MDRPLMLDRYRPLGEIGEGGFGTVELAWDTRIHRRVAVKRIPLPRDARGRSHLPPGLMEARTAAMLSHPHIVQVFDFDTDADEAFLVMEYVDGVDLGRILESEERLSLDEAAAVLEALCDAVAFAHDNGVLHLDIKPENILIDARGRVKIADFGLADLSSAMGYSQAVSGTVGYMPPEQIDGDIVDERTDIWAVASVALELLAGENLFSAPSPDRSRAKIEAPYLTPASTLRSELPTWADDVFDRALAPEPSARYESVVALANDLLPLLGDVRAGRDSLAIVVDDLTDDEYEDESESIGSLGLWDRTDPRVFSAVSRIATAPGAGWMAYLALSPLFPQDALVRWAGAALVGAAAAIAPRIGSLLAFLGFSVALLMHGAYLACAVLLPLVAAWWWFAGRDDESQSALAVGSSMLAALHLAPLGPLLAGFTLPWRKAAATGAFSGFAVALLTVATGGSTGIHARLTVVSGLTAVLGDALSDPATYVIVLGWTLAAVVMSIACAPASRVWASFGAIAGAAVSWGAHLLVARVLSGGDPTALPPTGVTVATLASLILMLVVALLGAPLRSEESDRP